MYLSSKGNDLVVYNKIDNVVRNYRAIGVIYRHKGSKSDSNINYDLLLNRIFFDENM